MIRSELGGIDGLQSRFVKVRESIQVISHFICLIFSHLSVTGIFEVLWFLRDLLFDFR